MISDLGSPLTLLIKRQHEEEIEPSSSDGQVESCSQENQDSSTSRDTAACSIHLSEWYKVSLDLVLQPGSCLLCSSVTFHVFIFASFSSEATWLPSQLGCWMMDGWWCHPTTRSLSSSPSSWLLCVCVCMCLCVCLCTCVCVCTCYILYQVPKPRFNQQSKEILGKWGHFWNSAKLQRTLWGLRPGFKMNF